MLHIGICDENVENAKYIEGLIRKATHDEIRYHVSTYASVDEMRQSEEDNLDLLYLSISFGGDLATQRMQCVREKFPDTSIILLADSPKLVYEGNLENVYAYMVKPVGHDLFQELLLRYIKDWRMKNSFYNVVVSGSLKRLNLEKVYYFESDVRVIIAHCEGETIRFYEKMDKLEMELSSRGFIRCHQSFLVNEILIEKLTREELSIHGKQLPISRKYYLMLKSRGLYNDVRRKSINMKNAFCKESGSVIGISGKFAGVIVHIQPEVKIVFGRDDELADFILSDVDISRQHCLLVYHKRDEEYELSNISGNSVFVDGVGHMKMNQTIILRSGDMFSLGQAGHVFKLG